MIQVQASLARVGLALAMNLSATPAVVQREEAQEARSEVTEQVAVEAVAPGPEDPASFATTVSVEDAEGRGADLVDLLRAVAGARVRDYGGFGSPGTLSLRASTAEQVTLLVDGVPQNRALGGAVDLSPIPATQIESITVHRGFAPAVLGVGGIGGLVDIRTRGAGAPPVTQVDLLAGQLDTARGSASVGLPLGRGGRLRVGAESLRSDNDYRFLDTNGTPFTTVDDLERTRGNNDVAQHSVLVAHAIDEIAGGTLHSTLRLLGRDRGVPGLGALDDGFARLNESLQELSLGWSAPRRAALDGVELRVDGWRQRSSFHDGESNFGYRSDNTTRFGGGGGVAIGRRRLAGHALAGRVELRTERADTRSELTSVPDRGGVARRMFAVTLEDQVTAGRTLVAPSIRQEWRDDDFRAAEGSGLNPPAPDLRDSGWTAKVGVAHPLGRKATLRGSFGRFERAPNLTELFGDRGAVRGNPALVAEHGIAAELGASFDSERSGWHYGAEWVAFQREVDDLIHFQPLSLAVTQARNLGEARIRGIEVVFALDSRPRGLALNASATIRQTEDRTAGAAGEGRELVYEPERIGALSATWTRSVHRLRWEATYMGLNTVTVRADPEFRIGERILHDVAYSWDAPGGTVLGVDVRNLFDRRVIDVLNYPLPGRVVLAHVGWHSDEAGTR